MASSPTEPRFFESFDGERLAWHEVGPKDGDARPVVLIHGLFSNAWTNWIRYGHAAAVAARGFRVIMPDLRAHGASAGPRDPAAYPKDVLAQDGMALLAHLGIGDYDLGGYSLGARTTARMLAMGATPGRVVLAGMGLEGLVDTGARSDHFRHILSNLGSHARGTPEWMAEAFLKTTGGDAQALLPLLDSFVDTPREQLAAIEQPVLVLSGEEDQDNGSHKALADLIPDAKLVEIPGGHMSAVIKPELGQAIAEFLS